MADEPGDDSGGPQAAVQDNGMLEAGLARIAAGDRAAFERLYRLTSAKLFSVCLRILPVRQEAEEALQEAYLTIWRRADGFDPARGRAMTWLITLTRNCAVDRLRARRPLATAPIELADAIADPAPSAYDLAEQRQTHGRLAACLGLLDAGDRQLVRTAFFEGSTYSELAERARAPLGTIKSRIRRALIKLAECLR